MKTGPRARSRVTGGKTVAGLAMALPGAFYQFGIETERLKTNPTRGVVPFKVKRREL